MSEPKPMSPLEKIKALKAEAEAKKNREAQEAAERASKELNAKQEKILEARKKFGEAQKLVDECTATYQETLDEMKDITDAELLEQVGAIVAESRTAKESAEASLAEAAQALEMLEERKPEQKNASPEIVSTETAEVSPNESLENKEAEPDFLQYESKFYTGSGLRIDLFQKDFDFKKMLTGEEQDLKFPEDAKRVADEIDNLARNPRLRTKERETLKSDVEKYVSASPIIGDIKKELVNAATKKEKEAVLQKINKEISHIDEYLIKVFSIALTELHYTSGFHIPTDGSLGHNNNLAELYVLLGDYQDKSRSPITKEQLSILHYRLANLQREAERVRESLEHPT